MIREVFLIEAIRKNLTEELPVICDKKWAIYWMDEFTKEYGWNRKLVFRAGPLSHSNVKDFMKHHAAKFLRKWNHVEIYVIPGEDFGYFATEWPTEERTTRNLEAGFYLNAEQ